LWYELDPALAADPALRAAAATAVRRRLAFWRGPDAGEMAYGLVQVGLAAAQLGLAGEAHEALTMLAGRYWRPSLVATHNRGAIFNVDICGGFPALVAAMLLRSTLRPGPRIDLLPALPAAWPTGAVRGLAARGQVTVRSLSWTSDRLDAVVVSAVDQHVTVGLPTGATERVHFDAGRPVRLRRPR